MEKMTAKRTFNIFFVVLFLFHNMIDGTHFRGGIISWRPINATPFGATAQILIHQRYFWWRLYSGFNGYLCTEADVTAGTTIPVYDVMTCLMNCTNSNYPSAGLSTAMITSDCQSNPLIQSWAGEKYDSLPLLLTTSITIGFQGGQWLSNLYIGANTNWSIVNRLDLGLRPDGYINSSPVTNTLPVIFYPINTPIVHIVQMADNDGTDILKCRWSDSNQTYNYNTIDECKGVCYGLPAGYGLTGSNCTLTFTLPQDGIYYAIALQIEDYYDKLSPSPMSSVPIQFLLFGYIPSSNCTRPSIIGVRPNRACIGVPYNVQLNETIIVQTYCPNQTIVDFVTASPYGMTHSGISHPSADTWVMTLTWTPDPVQAGPQSFCAAAVDNNNLQSDSWCITYLVNYDSPGIIRPEVVQGSASPVGTVFQNHSMFYIQAKGEVGRPTRNGTNVCFRNSATNISVVCYDAGYAPNVIYTGNTIIIITNVTWTPGQFYYVTMDSGFASGSVFCHAESAPVTNPTFWRYNIWDPAVSSTTTTTTTPFTTVTVTTRPTSTTSINTLLTTTGIVVTTTTPPTTTAAALTTTLSLTTATTVSTTSGTTSDAVVVINPHDLEQLCHHPILIMNIVMMVVFIPIHAVVMYAGFTKFSNMFNPVHKKAKERHNLRMRRILSH